MERKYNNFLWSHTKIINLKLCLLSGDQCHLHSFDHRSNSRCPFSKIPQCRFSMQIFQYCQAMCNAALTKKSGYSFIYTHVSQGTHEYHWKPGQKQILTLHLSPMYLYFGGINKDSNINNCTIKWYKFYYRDKHQVPQIQTGKGN